MKKNYMKPEGRVVAVSVNENIASSESMSEFLLGYKIIYNYVEGHRYISLNDMADGTDPMESSGYSDYNVFKDILLAIKNWDSVGNCVIRNKG